MSGIKIKKNLCATTAINKETAVDQIDNLEGHFNSVVYVILCIRKVSLILCY